MLPGEGLKQRRRTAEAAQQTVAVAQEGQITERFTRAIEQLGSDKIAIRLGGIYALERIAQDSPDKDQRQVIQVLTACVRENSQWDGCLEREQSFQPVPTDIQAILAVLGRLNTGYEEPEQRLDLHSTNLQGAGLMRAKLQWAILTNANIQRANLSGSNLLGAMLTNANLHGTGPQLRQPPRDRPQLRQPPRGKLQWHQPPGCSPLHRQPRGCIPKGCQPTRD